ncbi:hypothetical protein ACFL51_00690 [Myxococcota bacterium]
MVDNGTDVEESDLRGRSAPSSEALTAALAEVHASTDGSTWEIETAAIAVVRFAEDWFHAGVIYRPELESGELDEPHLLHLAFHYNLKCEPNPMDYSWVVPRIPFERAIHIPALCDVVLRRYENGGLSYAVKYSGEMFDAETGDYLTDEGRGLTCATFVLALYQSLGLQLIETETWELRDDDIRWHRDIILPELRSRFAEETEHHSAVEAQLPCARFRPQEVAAAGTAESFPVLFVYAQPVGEAIRQLLPVRDGA